MAPRREPTGRSPVPNGTYTVNILAGNGFGGTSAPDTRVFDITIEGETAFDNVDLSDTLWLVL